MRYLLIDDSYCFICGEKNPKGFNLSFTETDNGVSAVFVLDKEYQGYKDIIHGGLIAAILDEAMIKAANQKGYNAVTAELTVRFKNPLMIKQKARVDGKVLKESRKVLRATASLKREEVIIAEAEGKLYVPSAE
ncbi:MAG: PaaI family thioesterase [Thermodesulfovibrionales bacterium]